jgi:hypothetical protein
MDDAERRAIAQADAIDFAASSASLDSDEPTDEGVSNS